MSVAYSSKRARESSSLTALGRVLMITGASGVSPVCAALRAHRIRCKSIGVVAAGKLQVVLKALRPDAVVFELQPRGHWSYGASATLDAVRTVAAAGSPVLLVRKRSNVGSADRRALPDTRSAGQRPGSNRSFAQRSMIQRLLRIASLARFRAWQMGVDAHFVHSNSGVAGVYNYSPEKRMGLPYGDLIHAEPAPWRLELARSESFSGAATDGRWVHRDGTVRWLRRNVAGIVDDSGVLVGHREIDLMCEVGRQIRSKRRRKALREMHAASKAAVLSTAEGRMILHRICETALASGDFGHVSIGIVERASGQLLPVAWADVSGLDLAGQPIVVTDNGTGESTLTAEALRTGKPAVCQDTRDATRPTRYRKALLERGLFSAAMVPLPVDETSDGVLSLFSFDVAAFGPEELASLEEIAVGISLTLRLLHQEQRTQFLSLFDPLTGLPKRELFCKNLESTAAASAAVLLIDLVEVGSVNDTYGRARGDQLLRGVAARLRAAFPAPGAIAHFGAGTFAIVLKDTERSKSARDVMAVLLKEPFPVADDELRVSARVGRACSPEHGPATELLVQHAEAALKQTKQTGERWVDYAEPLHSQQVARLALEQKLRRALEREEFALHYQPKFDLDNRGLHGVEALLRWRVDGQNMAPTQFIPVLEATGMIEDLGYWIFERAARDCLSWKHAGLHAVRVAINVSPIQFRAESILPAVAKIAAAWARQGIALDLEITESAIMSDVEKMVEALGELSRAGVILALDDFGTGYSSLSLLAQLPLHQLKIDRSFIAQLDATPQGDVMVEAMIRMAHTFDMEAIAEGVESNEQLTKLRLMRCDVGQGHLFSPAVDAQELPKVLRAWLRQEPSVVS